MKMFVPRSFDFNILFVALLYYFSAEIGFFLAFDYNTSLPLWPPAGVALALTILYGRNVWPGIAMGSLLIAAKNIWAGAIDSAQMLMAVTLMVTVGSILEALVGELLFRKLVGRTYPFSTTLHTFYFVFTALAISWISSGFTTVALYAADVVHSGALIRTLFAFWTRNVVGILLFTSLLLSLPHVRWANITLHKAGEIAIFIACFGGVLLLLDLHSLRNVLPFALPFVVIPFLLWLAFRFKTFASIIGFIVVSLAAVYFTGLKQGPLYLAGFTSDSIILLQVYVSVISISALVLAAAVQERERAKADLKKFSENLESLVLDRTKALEEEVQSRKSAQQTLQDTNAELIKRNTELDSFVYSVSHDLRAPIASILGLINLAKKDKVNNAKHLYLDMMEKSAQQQDHFIREILDQSRNSRLEVAREPVLFKPLIEEAFEQLDYSNLNGNSFKKIISVSQSKPFYCDKWRLKIILNNIISNSIRYKNGKEPEITVDARIDQHGVNLSIHDNGRGIKKEHLLNLGKMFYRATDEGAGPGLGLYIVKETVGKLKGSLAIESEEGAGTTVRFLIPEVIGNQ
jgi:signal transduction histidine kinase